MCVCLCQLCNITTVSETCINPVGQWKRGDSGVEGVEVVVVVIVVSAAGLVTCYPVLPNYACG